MFITIEGLDGVGKTTQAILIKEQLSKMLTKDVILTREPAGAEVGFLNEKVREIIANDEESDPLSELFLICAARRRHIAKIIKPALEKGSIVVCDRFYDSSIAYFGYKDQEIENAIKVVDILHNMATESLMPDMTFLIDLDAQSAKERLLKRGMLDKFDSLDIESMEKIRSIFLKLAEKNRQRIVILDGKLSPDEMMRTIVSHIKTKLHETRNINDIFVPKQQTTREFFMDNQQLTKVVA